MKKFEFKNYLNDIEKEVDSIHGADPEIRLQLLDLSQKIIQKVKELRIKHGK